jgi:hypothetical protein
MTGTRAQPFDARQYRCADCNQTFAPCSPKQMRWRMKRHVETERHLNAIQAREQHAKPEAIDEINRVRLTQSRT